MNELTRDQALQICEILEITDEEAGEEHWQAYLTVSQIVDACVSLRSQLLVDAAVESLGRDRAIIV